MRSVLAAFALAAGVVVPVVLAADAAHAADVTAYANGALAAGWQNWSWACNGCAASTIQPGGPIVNDLGNWGGLYLTSTGTASIAPTATLSFKTTRLSTTANFLTVTLTRNDRYASRPFTAYTVPTVGLSADAQGFVTVSVPMASVNPSGLNFDGIQIQATSAWPVGSLVRFNNIAVTGASTVTAVAPTRANVSVAPTPAAATATINCASTMPISPRIYGVAFDNQKDYLAGAADDPAQWSIGATGRRWGGNPTTRFNPSINAWNLDNDWYFENIATARTWQQFVAADTSHGVGSVVSIPTLGWVAKDTTSNGFPVSVYGPQDSTDTYRPDAGNGVTNGSARTVTQPPTLTSTAFTAAQAGAWAAQVKAAAGSGRVDHYVLDNEPDLWSDTHRDVRTTPLRAAELVQNNRSYATAIRQADPAGKIAGPAISGFFGMRYSDYDNRNGFYSGGAGSDRALMGGKDLGLWYLEQMKAHETATGVKPLDLLDVHYYPQSDNVYAGGLGGLDRATAQLRIRSTRSLWDSGYVDESWYGDPQNGNPPVNLLPTLQGWINTAYAGLGLSIGEYSWGGEDHMSGAVAEAEVLGRFGQAITVGTQRYPGVESAYYWTYPAENTPTYWAMKGFRNFDGQGGGFGDASLDTAVSPAASATNALVSVFGSKRSATGELVAAVLNLTADKTATTTIGLSGCAAMGTATAYVYDGTTNGYVAQPARSVTGQQVAITSAPWTITFVRFAPGGQPPVNTGVPAVTGTPQVMRTLTADPGTWTGSPAPVVTLRWQSCTSATACTDVPNATASTYTAVAADQGRTMRVVATATNALGSVSVASARTATVAAAPTGNPPVSTSPPTITGTVQVNATLTAVNGAWTGSAPIAYAYQWRTCTTATACTDLPGGTGTTYRLTAAEQGRLVKVKVTATNSVGATSAESAPTATVTAVKPSAANSGVPAGTALTVYSGPTTITTPGTVVDAKTITQPIVIAADNVTVKRSSVVANNWAIVAVNAGVTGTRLEDVTITGGGSGFCVSGAAVTVVRANISGCDSAVVAYSGTTIDSSYLHDNVGAAVSAIYGAEVAGVTMRANNVVARATATYALSISEPPPNTVTAVVVTGNWLDGGQYTVNVDGTSVTFRNNRFGRTGVVGPKYPFTVNPLTGSGNVWDDNGQAVPGF